MRTDRTVLLSTPASLRHYPERLRHVAFRDPVSNMDFICLTNNFTLEATKNPAIYKLRRRVELLFKWIKQNVRIKHFFGTSENAVKTQNLIAVSVYLQVAMLKKELNIDRSHSHIFQILSVTPFQQEPPHELLAQVNSQASLIFDF